MITFHNKQMCDVESHKVHIRSTAILGYINGITCTS